MVLPSSDGSGSSHDRGIVYGEKLQSRVLNEETITTRTKDGQKQNNKKQHATTGASVGTMRAITGQFIAFYFRAPVKAFFRTRVDYMAFARAVNPRVQANEPWSWRMTTPGILAHAVKEYGWKFIPNNVLPPLLANVTVSTALYTTYLQSLGYLHEPASHASGRIFPPPSITSTLTAGCFAGSVQSLVAAPLDALQVRFNATDIVDGQYRNVWQYTRHKLHEIGLRGIFAGWTLSLVKDAVGYGLFFATFEAIKSQGFYTFASAYYSNSMTRQGVPFMEQTNAARHDRQTHQVKPHYAMEPTFILLAGVGASLVQQVIQHPISTIQIEHYKRLESIDQLSAIAVNKTPTSTGEVSTRKLPSTTHMLTVYYHAYRETFSECARLIRQDRTGWIRWLYRGFFSATVRQVPSTSAGLIVFELFRRRYASNDYQLSSWEEEQRRSSDGLMRVSWNGTVLALP